MSDLKKFVILIVDDDETLRNVAAFDFKRKGFTVLSAGSGNEAFDLVLKNHVDLVLSDVRMPGGDGVDLLERIREHNPDIPIVALMTGFSDSTEQECLEKGASRVFQKPFDRKQLMDFVYNSLGIN